MEILLYKKLASMRNLYFGIHILKQNAHYTKLTLQESNVTQLSKNQFQRK